MGSVSYTHLPSGVGSQVEIYGWRNGQMSSLGGAGLSDGMATLNRVQSNYLSGEYYPPALYVTGTLTTGEKVIDVLSYRTENGRSHLVNLSRDPETGVSRNQLHGYVDVVPTDINGDLVLELPSPTPLPSYQDGTASNFWLIDWGQYNENGLSSG